MLRPRAAQRREDLLLHSSAPVACWLLLSRVLFLLNSSNATTVFRRLFLRIIPPVALAAHSPAVVRMRPFSRLFPRIARRRCFQYGDLTNGCTSAGAPPAPAKSARPTISNCGGFPPLRLRLQFFYLLPALARRPKNFWLWVALAPHASSRPALQPDWQGPRRPGLSSS